MLLNRDQKSFRNQEKILNSKLFQQQLSSKEIYSEKMHPIPKHGQNQVVSSKLFAVIDKQKKVNQSEASTSTFVLKLNQRKKIGNKAQNVAQADAGKKQVLRLGQAAVEEDPLLEGNDHRASDPMQSLKAYADGYRKQSLEKASRDGSLNPRPPRTSASIHQISGFTDFNNSEED